MNLLLLLSALLSALSGAGVSARPASAAQAIASRSGVVAPRRAAPAATQRPVAALPAVSDVAYAAALLQPVLARVPLWMGRRRE